MGRPLAFAGVGVVALVLVAASAVAVPAPVQKTSAGRYVAELGLPLPFATVDLARWGYGGAAPSGEPAPTSWRLDPTEDEPRVAGARLALAWLIAAAAGWALLASFLLLRWRRASAGSGRPA
jgi:hypothetical protein